MRRAWCSGSRSVRPTPGGVGTWDEHIAAAYEAHQQGDYAEAEEQYSAALAAAEEFAPDDSRIAMTLHNLAEVYRVEGRYADAEAEELYERVLEIRETALGPEHPGVAQTLENYAALLRETGRIEEAVRMEGRAKTIRAGL